MVANAEYGLRMKKLKRIVGTALLSAFSAVMAAPARAAPVEIVALGDSLTAGYGLAPGQSFPEQLEASLKQRGHDVAVANAGVSGDTASDGLARLEWSVPAEADIVIVELGANDALRGIQPAVARAALSEIVATLKGRGQKVLLAGMLAPRNLGHAYTEEFDRMYADIAAEHDVPLYPFFLQGVAANAGLNQADGAHPTAEGIAVIVEAILPNVEALIAAEAAGD
jgi:acyl-CoA thioesterase I